MSLAFLLGGSSPAKDGAPGQSPRSPIPSWGAGGECELGACCRQHWSPQPGTELLPCPLVEVPVCPQEVHKGAEGKGLCARAMVASVRGEACAAAWRHVPRPALPTATPARGVAVKEWGQKGSRSSSREFPDAYRCEIQSFMSRSCPCLNLVVSVIFFSLLKICLTFATQN